MKRAKSLVILGIVLVVVIIGYIVAVQIAKREEKKNEVPEETVITLIDKEAADISEIYYKSAITEYTVEKPSSVYFLKEDHGFPLDQSIASLMFDAAAYIDSDRLVTEDRTLFAEYGLDTPAYVISVRFTDGTSYTMNIGDHNKYSGTSYMNPEGTDNVYMIDSSITGNFEYTKKDLLTDETVTSPGGLGYVKNITVGFSDGEGYTLAFVEGTEAETDEDGKEVTPAVPDIWTKTLADGTVLDVDATETATNIYNEIFKAELDEWADYNVTEEEKLDKYGLKTPYCKVTVNYTATVSVTAGEDSSTVTKEVDKSVSVIFGDTVPDAEADETSSETGEQGSEAGDEEKSALRYFMTDGGKVVYIISEANFTSVFAR